MAVFHRAVNLEITAAAGIIYAFKNLNRNTENGDYTELEALAAEDCGRSTRGGGKGVLPATLPGTSFKENDQ